MFHRIRNVFFTLILLLFCLCGSPRIAADSDQLVDQAKTILARVMQSIVEGDYDLYSRDFSKRMKESQDRETFLQLQSNLQKSLGKFRFLEYLGFYNQYGGTVTLFKARFSKESEDVLIRLVLDSKKSPPQIVGLWFDSPALEN